MTSWTHLWQRLDEQTQHEAAEAFWEHAVGKRPPVDHPAVQFVSRTRHMRPHAVRRMPLARQAKLLARSKRLPPELVRDMLVALHLHRRTELLVTFLDLLGVPHEHGVIENEPDDALPVEQLRTAIGQLRSQFPGPHVETYLDVLGIGDSLLWANLPTARADTPVIPATQPGLDASDREEAVESPLSDSLGVPAAEEFTTLDIVLIEQVVSALQEAEGALDEEQIADLVDEVVHLNSQRHKSYFHAGFVDVLLDLDARWTDPEMNPSRLGWYLSGAITGHLRRNESKAAFELLQAHPDAVSAIGAGRHDATSMSLGQYFDVLWEHAGPAAVCSWLRPRGAAMAGPSFLMRLLDTVKGLLRRYQLEHAAPLLDVLEEAFKRRQSEGDVVPKLVLAQVQRQRAHALRLAGDFDRAREILEGLVASGEQSQWGMAIADLGLMDAGYRALGDIRFPEAEADVSALIETLDAGAERFAKAAGSPGPDTGHGAYALGLLKALSGESKEAVQLLSRAVASMQRHDSIYSPLRILPRARLGLALAVSESLDAARAQQAVEYTEQAVRALGSGEVPGWLIRRILVGLSAIELGHASDLVSRLEEGMGAELLDPGLAAGLLCTLPVLRMALLDRARDHQRPRSRRFDDLVALLTACRECGDRDTQEEALDGLEELARGGTRVDRFIELLEQGQHDPAWADEDARTVRMSLLESAGRCNEAARYLCDYGHARLSEGGEHGLAVVRDILDHVSELGVADVAADLAARVQALTRQEEPQEGAPRKGLILVVGGNETQEQYNAQLHAHVAARWPDVRLEIRNTGWTSNWGRQLEAMEGVLGEASVVVVLTMIRTKLGRSIRRICSDQDMPWVPCTGTGLASLRRSVETAVALL